MKISALRAWVVLAAATGINIAMGINYSWSVIKKALVSDWHWTNMEAALPYTVYFVVIAVFMMVGGRLQDRMGPRPVLLTGAFLMGAGLIACSLMEKPLTVTLAYGAAAIGASLCLSTTLPTCIKWFPPEKKGLVTGIVVGGSALAPAYISPIANWLLGHYGISSTFLAIGVGICAALLIMTQFMDNPPAGWQSASVPGKASPAGLKAKQTTIDKDWRGMLETAAFYKLWMMYLFASGAGLMIIGHLTTIAKTQADWDNGFYLLIWLAVFNAVGRIAAGALSDRYGCLAIMKAVFLLLGLNLLLFAYYTSPALLVAGTVVTGLCYGSCFALFPLATADLYGIKNLGGNYGLLFSGWGCAALLGPLLGGWAVDATGQYVLAYRVFAGSLLVALILAFTVETLADRLPIVRPVSEDNV